MVVNNYIPNLRVFEKSFNELQGNKKVASNNVDSNKELSFSNVLKEELQKVNEKQINSDNAIQGYVKGEKDIHEVMVASEEAKLSLELAIQVRNKILNAYEEFNKMQV
jgi:flagellar hook-basal body complex protein FliE